MGLLKNICENLGIDNITNPAQKVLIDDLIEVDPYYKNRISNLLKYKKNCGISPVKPWEKNK